MSSIAIGVLVVLGAAYAAFAVPFMLQFYSYCEQVAKATGRTEENQVIWNTDEGGNNAFKREQWRMLRTGEYAQLNDPVLVSHGHALARKTRLSWWLAVGLVVAVVAAHLATT
jgi:hypothetical protein